MRAVGRAPWGSAGLSRDGEVDEFFILPGNVRAFGLTMDARTGDALGEMAPIRRL